MRIARIQWVLKDLETGQQITGYTKELAKRLIVHESVFGKAYSRKHRILGRYEIVKKI